ncbi:Hypothetical predicted protein [Octopus vulgaris]|uniref:Myb/SANT-like DNA-binding domain-containing protein n=1 Tax=Octopus vulgaris TaxID=6645 RepID=A0AA36B719_OCTVU|nr:Hypothetical predicted protein [Octopus vulgaris]
MNSGDVTMSAATRFKKRCENYSRKDKEKLLELVTKRVDILESKVSNSNMNLQKAMCWVDIAKEFNEGSSEIRDDRQLKELWKRMKYNSRMDLLRFMEKRNNLRPGDKPLDSLDEFTLILVRLIPDYFQMDSDPKVRLQCRELLLIDPKLFELRVNKIHEILNESDTNGSINNSNSNITTTTTAATTTTTTNNNNINNNNINFNNNNSNDNSVNFQRINENSSDEDLKVFSNLQHQALHSLVDGSMDGSSQDQQQNFISDTNIYVSSGLSNDTTINKRADSCNPCNNSSGAKDFENFRKRKIPLYRSLLEEENNEDIKRQLLEMAQKENEKELLLLDIQVECEKQRLIKEKIEAENAELKQRMLLQILENQTNQRNSYPPLMFHL